jgi:hypothetical protein
MPKSHKSLTIAASDAAGVMKRFEALLPGFDSLAMMLSMLRPAKLSLSQEETWV